MIDRKWLLSLNILFDTKKSIGEDTCFWLELMKNDTYLIGIDKPLTIVHIGDNAAAYSDQKQIIGYLLQDNYYSKFNQELSYIMQAFIGYVTKESITDQEKRLKEHLKEYNSIQKLFFFMRTEGLKSTTRRVASKVKNNNK